MNFTLQLAALKERRRILGAEIANARLRRAAAEAEAQYWIEYEATKCAERMANVSKSRSLGYRIRTEREAERQRLAARCA